MSVSTGELPPHLLHILPTAQSVELIGAFGGKLRHTLVTPDGTLPEGLRASSYIKPANDFPVLTGLKLPGRMQKLARAMTPFDLVLTHGASALDVAMAHTMFKDVMSLPALIHHENDPDAKRSLKKTWYRRIALGKSSGIVVPGERLEEAALVDWQQPMGRAHWACHWDGHRNGCMQVVSRILREAALPERSWKAIIANAAGRAPMGWSCTSVTIGRGIAARPL